MRGKKDEKGMMTIKVDLEKAYDRLSWEFITDTLREIGFDETFVDLIYQCLSSCTMQVLINDEKSEPFSTSRGIRRGIPYPPTFLCYALKD